jgi:hypothetical protein
MKIEFSKSISIWLKILGIAVPVVFSIIGGAIVVGNELNQTKENTKDIDIINHQNQRIERVIVDIQMRVARNQFIDSLMFLQQGKILRKLNIEP